MIKPKVIEKVLEQTVDGGVQYSMLLTIDGALLAYSGGEEKQAKMNATIAAIYFHKKYHSKQQMNSSNSATNLIDLYPENVITTSSIVNQNANDPTITTTSSSLSSTSNTTPKTINATTSAATTTTTESSVKKLMLQLNDGELNMYVSKCKDLPFLVCLLGNSQTEKFGLLKLKANAIIDYIHPQLATLEQ